MVLDSEIAIIKEVEIPEAFVRLRSDGIVYVYYKKNVMLDVELQMRMDRLFKEITGNRKAGFIFQSEESVVLTEEARKNAIRLEKDSAVGASAIVVSNLASRILANFFIKMHKPEVQHKLFGSVDEAIKWLKAVEAHNF